MSGIADTFIAYKFIRQLSTPWKKWDAFKLGLIDAKGATLKKAETAEEELALPMWKILIKNIKKVLEKLPGGSSKLGSFAAGLWLIKEEMGVTDIKVLEEEFLSYLDTQDILVEYAFSEDQSIGPGKYAFENDILFLKEEATPIGICLGEHVFDIKTITGTATRLVTIDQIRRL